MIKIYIGNDIDKKVKRIVSGDILFDRKKEEAVRAIMDDLISRNISFADLNSKDPADTAAAFQKLCNTAAQAIEMGLGRNYFIYYIDQDGNAVDYVKGEFVYRDEKLAKELGPVDPSKVSLKYHVAERGILLKDTIFGDPDLAAIVMINELTKNADLLGIIRDQDGNPDLKADQNFRELQAQLEGTENRISVARKRYIDKVADYNTMVRSFPTNLTAHYLLHLQTREAFSISNEAKAAPKA